MTSVATPGLDNAPTTHARLLAWVQEMAELTTPDQVVWVDGSDEEWERLTGKLVEAGTFRRLDAKPNSFWCASDPQRRRPGRGPHLHLLGRRGRRRSHQQLDGPGRDEVGHDRAVPRVHARPDDVRHPVLHGPGRGREPDVRRRAHRLRVRRRLDAGHGPHRQPRSSRRWAPTGRSCRPCTPSAPRSTRASRTSRGPAATPSTSSSSPRSG